ncbi:M20/M25/M40 family metallo-hydrolase [Candidatus Bipolaricaulota bacterium]|nr:M20/M25/M40 family metallo-hydrolase [Candidatus Bipolaricaulota bacterium]
MGDLAQILMELTQLVAPSGHEAEVARYIRERAEESCARVYQDTLGNVIIRPKEHPGVPRVAIIAHMDEIGFVVRRIEENGFLRVVRLGGIEEKSLPGKEVLVLGRGGEKIPGAVGLKAHHLAKPEERLAVTQVEEVYIDVGAESREDALGMGIEVGCPVVFSRTFLRRGPRILANSLDNRGGCAALLALVEEIRSLDPPCEAYLIASVQEEFSLRGVLPAIRVVEPDLIICLDISPACDTPDLAGYADLGLGSGPTVNLYSFHGRGTLAGLIPRKAVVEWATAVAAAEGIPLQRSIFFGGLTDASFAQLEGRGIPALELGFPVRYPHSPIEACDLRDLELLVKLVAALLLRLDREVLSGIQG